MDGLELGHGGPTRRRPYGPQLTPRATSPEVAILVGQLRQDPKRDGRIRQGHSCSASRASS